MNILIYGAGGVGGYFGGKLAARFEGSETVRVSFVARGEHLDCIRREGLLLNDSGTETVCRPYSASADIGELPAPDVVLLCVKSYDLPEAVRDIMRVAGTQTIVMPLANGVDIPDRIRAAGYRGTILPACVYVGTHIERPGKVARSGGAAQIVFGSDPLHATAFSPAEITGFFRDAGIESLHAPDPGPAIWRKFLFISAFGLVTAHSGLTLGAVSSDPGLMRTVRGIMTETASIAARKGVRLSPDAVDAALVKAGQFPPETKTSYQRDVEAGRKDEGELFGGTIIRLGRELGIATPVTTEIYRKIENGKKDKTHAS